MELRHLRYFMAAAEEEHFGRASERLCVTRPAVSQLIADLEDELGTLLFDRISQRVKLTAAGATLLQHLYGVMKDLEEAIAVTKRVGQGKTGSLTIGYGSLTLMHNLFRETIKQFRKAYPDVTLSLLEMSTNEQPRALAEGRIHAGFMHFGPGRALLRSKQKDDDASQNRTVLDWVRIQNGSLGVATPKEHPLTRQSTVNIADLANEQFIVVPRSTSSPGYGPLHLLCRNAGFDPKILQEVGTISTQLNLISVGMGIGLVPTGGHFIYPDNVSVIPFVGVDYETTFVFGWVKGQRSPALDRMIEIVTELSE